MNYSPFLQTLYDQAAPVGNLGRGTHYSVLRALCWHDHALRPSPTCLAHDVAVIWDEDHDTRVIRVIERSYIAGVLPSILFIGERKGSLSLLVSAESGAQLGATGLSRLARQFEAFVDPTDPWTAEATVFGRGSTGIISADSADTDLFLRSIHMLWRLGSKQVPL